MAGIVLKDLMLLHIFTTKANHPQALMKKKPAILSLLPSATASGFAVSTLSGYGMAWPSNSSPGAKGLQTGSRTFVVGDGSSFSAEAVYYDWRSQPVQKHCIDHRGTREDLFLNLSFTGKTVASRKVVTPYGGAATVVTREMSYDGWDRLAGEVTTVSGGGADATDRVTYSYDDVGRMTGRTYGEPGSAGSTAETLSYNARGWLTGQASPVYSSTLRYTDPSRTSTAGRYGGSISEWSWSRGSGSGMQTYAFSYDGLDRLTGSKRYIGSSTAATDAFTEQGLEYDRNGNIKALVRYGQSAADPEDDLLFTLSGNRIWTISNSGSNGSGKTYSAFAYDANGNTTHDGRTGQDLVWNALNLLSGATVTEGGVTSTLATYTWLADGTKYSTERPDGSGYVYKGELIYTKAPGGALTLDCVLTTGGRIVAERDTDGTLSGYSVRHHIRDHLGSVRAVTDGSTGEVLETSDYLPFGTRWALTGGTQGATSTITDPSNRWRYSGKEEQQALSPALSLLDYGARMYDPTLARWLTPDPLAEKQYQSGPYSFCYGNPNNYVDPNGEFPLAGLLIGAGLDIAIQITNNLISGDNWNNIDLLSVAISAASGAAGAGLISKVKQIKGLVNLGKTALATAEVVTNGAISGVESITEQLLTEGSVSFSKASIDAGSGALASGIGKGVKIYKIKNSEMELKRLYKAYDYARRVARGSRPSRIARMEEAKKELENFGTREEILAESLATYFESIFIDLFSNLSSNPNKDEQHYE